MMNHEKVFKIAKRDDKFQADLKLSDQTFPRGLFIDTLEKGIWAAGYAGWVLGKYGSREYLRRRDLWRVL